MTTPPTKTSRKAEPGKRRVGRPPGSRAGEQPRSESAPVGRDTLIDSTCELLRTTQPAEITRALVARETGVDPSLIRYYFSNRSMLLIAAGQRLTERYQQMVEAAVARSDGSPRSLLCERITALVDLIATYPYFHRLFVEEIMPSDIPEARAVFEAVTARGSSSYDAIVRAGVEEGIFREVDHTLLFTAIIGMSEFYTPGTRVMAQASGRVSALPEPEMRAMYTRFICDIVMNGILNRPAETPSDPRA